jgi:hypothetical protein
MTCADVERVLPELMDGAPDGVGRSNNAAFQNAFDAHVRSCPDCSELVSDLKVIASEAQRMAASEEPSPRVWLNIAAQLRAEGLIREQEAAPSRPILVPTFRRRGWSAWWLVPIAAALVAAGSYVVSHKQYAPVAQVQSSEPPTPPTSAPPTSTSAASDPAPAASPSKVAETPTATQTPSSPSTPAPIPADQQVARQTAAAEKARFKEEAEPASDDEQFLSAVATSAPAMRATYESQLKAVNADIQETQAYVDQNPADADARQHLMDAFQQKALLYQIALDHIQ